jgi:hypothetical protein
MYVLASIGENLHSTQNDLPGGISPTGVKHSNIGWSKFSCKIGQKNFECFSITKNFLSNPLFQ